MIRLVIFAVVSFMSASCLQDNDSRVRVDERDGNYSLLVNGEPFFVKGVGGQQNFAAMKEAGVNSFRIWGLDNAEALLDSAQKYDLMVAMGLWVAHERHGFDYNDETRVTEQLENFERQVNELVGHPNILMWVVGNEVDLMYSNTKVWNAVEDIAAMIKKTDPDHPTMTITAGIDSMEVSLIKTHCPSIDILGINTYGGLDNLPEQIDTYGWTKAYMVTEWGPTGHWEIDSTDWGVPIEETADEKAAIYRKRYLASIARDSGQCIGSYVFYWGQKQETTPTWYGLFLESGESLPTKDAVQRLYTGRKPQNSAPELKQFVLAGTEAKEAIYVEPSSEVEATYHLKDVDGDSVVVRWEILPESTDKKAGGDLEDRPQAIKMTFISSDSSVIFNTPQEPGPYRLFLYAYDGKRHATTANIPFFVQNTTKLSPLSVNGK